MSIKKAYFAAGCFWGVEYYFQRADGIKKVVSGYMGGHVENPSYEAVCTGTTGHLETVEVEYDENIINYENLVKLFFEIHDFTQEDGQGPDIGNQYLSGIFYSSDEEKTISNKVIDLLSTKGYKVATKLYEKSLFYKAEDYHQNYYNLHGNIPYCHAYKKIF